MITKFKTVAVSTVETMCILPLESRLPIQSSDLAQG